jgi:DnaJ domain
MMSFRLDGNDPELLYVLCFLAVVFVILTITAFGGAFLFIIMGLVLSKLKTGDKPIITAASEFDSKEDFATLEALRFKLDDLRQRKARIYHDADHHKLMRRSRDPRRFDARSTLAKLLNARLLTLDEEFKEIVYQIQKLKYEVCNRRRSWSQVWVQKVERWNFYSNSRFAFRVALFVYIATVVTLLWFYPDWAEALSAAVGNYVLIHVSALSSFYGTILIATGLSATIGYVPWVLHFGECLTLPDEQEFNALWVQHNSSESVYDFENTFLPPNFDSDSDESDERDEGGRQENNEEQSKFEDDETEMDGCGGQQSTWYELLGVAPDASFDQIKSAYWTLIKQYHPDRVATLGPKLIELAEAETKRLNAAYEQAMKDAKQS